MLTFDPDGDAMRQLMIDLDQGMRAAAEAGAKELKDNISAGNRSGIHYQGDPRRASAPSEFPQEQRGDLIRSVDVAEDYLNSGLEAAWEVGFFGEDPEKIHDLEIREWKGNRSPLKRTFEDPYVLDRMDEALQEVG